jgi:ACS family tartrate transporter-like MFS transporter
MLFNAAHSDGRFERYLHTTLPYCLVAAAFLAMGSTVIPGVVVLGYVVYYTCHAAGQGSFWLIPSDILHGRAAAGGLAAVNTIGQMGAFFGPIAWGLSRDHSGSYQHGLLAVSFSFAGAAAFLLLVRHMACPVTKFASETDASSFGSAVPTDLNVPVPHSPLINQAHLSSVVSPDRK